MRDPKRIDEICETIRKEWHKVPDWRLGQLLVNSLRGHRCYPDLFYVEDDELMKLLNKMMEGVGER